ncbi:MAG: RES family NAD+ phosphorylase, partial [Rhodothermales bacterium]
MQPLADDPEELAFLEELEGMTSARQGRGLPFPAGVSPNELLTEQSGYGWTYVNAAFCYTRSTGNRFNGPDRGAWYAAWGDQAIETAQQEVCWHLTRELEAVGNFENVTKYRELIAGFTTGLHDLRDIEDEVLFNNDPATAYPASQALAAQLIGIGSNGVLFPSVRHPEGHCLACFRPNIVQNIRQGSTWVFEWGGTPAPK